MALQLGFEEQEKVLILKVETEEKVFQIEGILSKKTRKWTVLEHHVGFEARKIQRIMSKMEKTKNLNIVFSSPHQP